MKKNDGGPLYLRCAQAMPLSFFSLTAPFRWATIDDFACPVIADPRRSERRDDSETLVTRKKAIDKTAMTAAAKRS